MITAPDYPGLADSGLCRRERIERGLFGRVYLGLMALLGGHSGKQ